MITASGTNRAVISLSEYDENEFLEALVLEATDEDWADFWVSEDPAEVLMNDQKLEEAHG